MSLERGPADLAKRKPKRNKLVKKSSRARHAPANIEIIPTSMIQAKDLFPTQSRQQFEAVIAPERGLALKQTPLSSQRFEPRKKTKQPATDETASLFSLLSKRKKSKTHASSTSSDTKSTRHKAQASIELGCTGEWPLRVPTPSTSPSKEKRSKKPATSNPKPGVATIKRDSLNPLGTTSTAVRGESRFDGHPRVQPWTEHDDWPLKSATSPEQRRYESTYAFPTARPKQNDSSIDADSPGMLSFGTDTSPVSQNTTQADSVSKAKQFEFAPSRDSLGAPDNWVVAKYGKSSIGKPLFTVASATKSTPDMNAFFSSGSRLLSPTPPLPRLMTQLSPPPGPTFDYSPSVYDDSPLSPIRQASTTGPSIHSAGPLSPLNNEKSWADLETHPSPEYKALPLVPGHGQEKRALTLAIPRRDSCRYSAVSELSCSDLGPLSSYEVSPIDETDMSQFEWDEVSEHDSGLGDMVNKMRLEDEQRARELRDLWLGQAVEEHERHQAESFTVHRD